MRKTTNTPKQLVPAYLDSKPASWRQDYVRNLRPVRGYPTWWRIVDNVAYIDGPPAEGAQYTRDLYVWKASVLQDAAGNNTDTLELYNLVELLDNTERTLPNGDTEYRYKYSDIPPALTYEHTDVIDSVSLEFDQLGRRLVAFESAGDIFLIWHDPVPGTMVVTNWGGGYNPQIVTDTYRRTGVSSNSERILFYVDSATKQIVYRSQNDRYQTAYTLPSAPADVVELLKVSKNLYGGLTVLYCYDDGTGSLKTGSFTARDAEDAVHIGSDRHPESQASVRAATGAVVDFVLKAGLKETSPVNEASIIPASGTIVDFVLRENTVYLNNQTSSASVSTTSGTISDFSLKSVQIDLESQKSSESVSATSGVIQDFLLQPALIQIASDGSDSASVSATSGTLADFFLG